MVEHLLYKGLLTYTDRNSETKGIISSSVNYNSTNSITTKIIKLRYSLELIEF